MEILCKVLSLLNSSIALRSEYSLKIALGSSEKVGAVANKKDLGSPLRKMFEATPYIF